MRNGYGQEITTQYYMTEDDVYGRRVNIDLDNIIGSLQFEDNFVATIDVQRAINRLPSTLKTIIQGHYFEGKSVEQIAKEMKSTEWQIDRLLHRAEGRLRMELRNYKQPPHHNPNEQ